MTLAGRQLAINCKSCNYMPTWIFENEFILFILYFYLALPSFSCLAGHTPNDIVCIDDGLTS